MLKKVIGNAHNLLLNYY